MTTKPPPLRVLVAKVGLDGHDRGARVISRLLRDMGHEVIYLGRRQTPETIARVALDEDVQVVGLSVLSGTHVDSAARVLDAMRNEGVNAPLVLGGTVLRREVPLLLSMGVDAVFPVGTRLEEIQAYFSSVGSAPSSSPG